MKRIIDYFTGKYLAAWVVLLSDAALVFVAYVVSVILRLNFELHKIDFDDLMIQSFASMALYVLFFKINHTSSAVLRHSGLKDLVRVVKSGLAASAILMAYVSFMHYILGYSGLWLFPKSVIIIQFLLVVFLLSLSRLTAKATYAAFLQNNSDLKTNILIYGAGESGRITCQTILSGRSSKREITTVIGFIDDNTSLQGKSLEGRMIYSPSRVLKESFVKRHQISQLIISVTDLPSKKKRQITDFCLKQGVEVKEIPPYDHWIHGRLSLRQIKNIRIENLLGRSEIALDSQNIGRELKGKTILVTGGAGSIGSEIVRQSLHFAPKKVIALDQAESALYDLEMSLTSEFEDDQHFEMIVGDINNQQRMKRLFETYRPDLVFHAAAYKHVPLMELNPYEAVVSNVFGSKIIADLSSEFGVGKFVMISTDKAVNPTNVMGATKRIAEMYVQSLNGKPSDTSFIITRFGNVLGSNGSVIPLFQRQIEQGGPVTVTHKDITRYFMTIAEACNLVLEAGSMGNNGEIFVFDMGKPVRIYEMAQKMIQLSGLQEGKDISITTIGLRPGEKLYEEVLAREEDTIPTHHEKILKASINSVDEESLNGFLLRLSEHVSNHDKDGMVNTMKEIVPEYISNNSEFSKLDIRPTTVP